LSFITRLDVSVIIEHKRRNCSSVVGPGRGVVGTYRSAVMASPAPREVTAEYVQILSVISLKGVCGWPPGLAGALEDAMLDPMILAAAALVPGPVAWRAVDGRASLVVEDQRCFMGARAAEAQQDGSGWVALLGARR
jgi:hypothetical protein